MPSFGYHALSYLDEWSRYDQHFMKVLNVDNLVDSMTTTPSSEVMGIALQKVATHYSVMRNFPVNADEGRRFMPVVDALCKVQRPRTDLAAIEAVDTFARELQKTYGKFTLSAASKFLWMRFGDPVIIYDSSVTSALKDYKYDGYASFYHLWMKHFVPCRQEVSEGCLEVIKLKPYIRSSGLTDFELELILRSEWFIRRVFDNFLQDIA